MENTLFSRYADTIRTTRLAGLTRAADIPAQFLLAGEAALQAHYIPFEHVNSEAKVVLVGITPGFTQWSNAMHEAQRQMLAGASAQATQIAAKRTGAFSGAMRPNLVNLLDAIGLQHWLELSSCAALFGDRGDLVHTTSILRHPVFVNGENYNGTPNMIRTPMLQKLIVEHFVEEISRLHDPVFIPLGPKVSEGLGWLAQRGVLKPDRILDGLPHPSGANAERIAYFLGRKERSALSSKTNPAQLDAARTALLAKVRSLP